MPVDTRELLHAVAIIAEQKELRITVKESAKGAMICGTACFVGGILLGPVGLAAGGFAGALAAAKLSKGKFKSAADVIRNELTDAQRQQLVQHIMAAVADLQITDVAILLPLMTGNVSPALQAGVLKGLSEFLSNDMRLQLID